MAAVDDVYESWEDMDDIGLDRKITNFLAATPVEKPKKNDTAGTGEVKVVFEANDPLGAQIMAQQPTVKILKRPVAVHGSNSNESKTRPVKTFQQRQQEYEQARLRILGEAKSPEDVAEESITSIRLKLEMANIKTINRTKERPIEILSSRTNASSVQQRIIIAQPPNLVTLIRSPKGPDGTKGFNLKR